MEDIPFKDNYAISKVAPVESEGEIVFIARLLPEEAKQILEKMKAADEALGEDDPLSSASAITERWSSSDISFTYKLFGSKSEWEEAKEAIRTLPPKGESSVSTGIYNLTLEELGYEDLTRLLEHEEQTSLFAEEENGQDEPGDEEDRSHPFEEGSVSPIPFGLEDIPASISEVGITGSDFFFKTSVPGQCLSEADWDDWKEFRIGPFSRRSVQGVVSQQGHG